MKSKIVLKFHSVIPRDFVSRSSEMDGGNNFFSAKNAPERQSKRARADSQFDSEGSSRLGE